MLSNALDWVVGVFGSFWGKVLAVVLIGAAFFLLKLRLDVANAQLEKSRLEASVLQNANQKQHAAIQILLENAQKQNQLLADYEQEKRQAEQNLVAAKERLRAMDDNESAAWKKQNIPQGIRALLQKE